MPPLGWNMVTAGSPRGPVQYAACPPQLQRRGPWTAVGAPAAGATGTSSVRSASATYAPVAQPVHAFTASVRSSSAAGSIASGSTAYANVVGAQANVRSSSTTSTPVNIAGYGAPSAPTVRSLSGTTTSLQAQTVGVAAAPGAPGVRCQARITVAPPVQAAQRTPGFPFGDSNGLTPPPNRPPCAAVATLRTPLKGGASGAVEASTSFPTAPVTVTSRAASPTAAYPVPSAAHGGGHYAVPFEDVGVARSNSQRSRCVAEGHVPESDEDFISPTRSYSASKTSLLIATINFIFRSIVADPVDADAHANSSTWRAFQERQYHGNKPMSHEKAALVEPFTSSLQDCASAGHVTEFILMMLHRGYFDVSEFIISVLYLVRFKDKTGIPLHKDLWRTLFLTSLLLADKMWEDKSVKNSSLTMLFPVLSNAELFDLEVRFLEWLNFSAWVTKKDFASFCDMLLNQEAASLEIAKQVMEHEFVRSLNEGAAQEQAQVKPAMRKGKIPIQPWNVRKTLHGYSPSKRTTSCQSAPPGQCVLPLQADNGHMDTNEYSTVSPRRRPAQVAANAVNASSSWKGGQAGQAPSLHHAVSSSATFRNRFSDSDLNGTGGTVEVRGELAAARRFQLEGNANRARGADEASHHSISATHSPRRLVATAAGAEHQVVQQPQAAERRPMSEPRVVQQGGPPGQQQQHGVFSARFAKGRPPPAVVPAVPGQYSQTRLGRQAVASTSPRANVGHHQVQDHRAEAQAPAPSDRCSSAPVPVGRIGGQHAQSQGVTTVSKPPPPAMNHQQRLQYPFGPTNRSTVPMPGAARTARSQPGQPKIQSVVQATDMHRHAMQRGPSTPQVAGSLQPPTASLLNRGRSSSPAGIADGHAPPPSARRNVAAPPPTMRPAVMRFGP